jgi:ubiquitin carboxyl-terminal hydrolase 14
MSLTGVDPSRQKVMCKGKIWKPDTDLSSLGLKDGQQIMLMGTVGEISVAPPVQQVQFVEDMTQNELAQALQLPTGLENLGNTCYMNATIQLLRKIPELKEALNELPPSSSNTGDNNQNLVSSLKDLFNDLDKGSDGYPPFVFLQILRLAFPKFAQQEGGGHFSQQDAEECWTSIVSVLKDRLKKDGEPFVDQFMSGQFKSVLTCDESSEEPATESAEPFYKLDCHISKETNHMTTGIEESLKQSLEKNSDVLGRNAQWTKKFQITRLPKYLPINFVRFFWKATEQKKAKILKKVKFPMELDMNPFCDPALQKKLEPVRERLRVLEEEAKSRKVGLKNQENKEEKLDVVSYADQSLVGDKGCNFSGYYQLIGVLTHTGRTADSGHYIGWVRKDDTDDWYKFDDDYVSMVKTEDIQKLDGGGDWHMAYICLYGPKNLEKPF